MLASAIAALMASTVLTAALCSLSLNLTPKRLDSVEIKRIGRRSKTPALQVSIRKATRFYPADCPITKNSSGNSS